MARVALLAEGVDRNNVNQGTNLMADAELALTPYGLEYLTLRRLVVISIRSAGECR